MTRKKGSKQARVLQPISKDNPLERYRQWMSTREFELLSEEVEKPLLPSIRINPLKTSHEFPSFLSQKFGWQLQQIPYCKNGFLVQTGSGPGVSNTLEHRLGLYYVQEAASMLPVELFSDPDQDPGLTLDMAASPGGKTTHLVSRLNDRGLVIANDSSQGRIQALRVVLQNWGAVHAAVTCLPGESYGSRFPGVFDRVLLDAPCSMQGLRTAESHPVKNVTERETRQLANRQVALLRSAIQALRPGGEVVYSTCTLLPQEDELVVDTILKDFKGGVSLLDAQRNLPVPAPGLQNVNDNPLHPGMNQTIRLWPHRYQTAGFFACILHKETETTPAERSGDSFLEKPLPMIYLSTPERDEIFAHVESDFGFDLRNYCESEGLILTRHFERIHLFPEILAQRFSQLKTQSAGMLLGETTPDGFLPSFEWLSRFGPGCTNNVIPLDEEQTSRWMRGQNLSAASAHPDQGSRYRILLNAHHQALGCGKLIGNELKNLLPRRLIYTSSSS